jgi:RNA recognition motif-containing protein
MNFLSQHKPIRARLMKDENSQSKGTCFVQLSSVDNAREAILNLSNTMFQGRKVIINPAYNQSIKGY